MNKVFLKRRERFISRVNLYFGTGAQYLLFDGILGQSSVFDYICTVYTETCGNLITQVPNCLETLSQLPTLESGGPFFDGDSTGCRSLHAVFAASNTKHCAHISFDPLEDSDGEIKCQVSEKRLDSEFFTEEDIQFYETFSTSVGVDPELGHNCNTCGSFGYPPGVVSPNE